MKAGARVNMKVANMWTKVVLKPFGLRGYDKYKLKGCVRILSLKMV